MYIQQPVNFETDRPKFLPGLLALLGYGAMLYLLCIGFGVAPRLKSNTEPFQVITVPPEKELPPTAVPRPELAEAPKPDQIRLPLPPAPVIPIADEKPIDESQPGEPRVERQLTGGDGPVAVAQPQAAKLIQPSYPMQSRRANEEGTVQVSVHVGTNGKVLAARVDRSSGYRRLDDAAIEAAWGWRFTPAMRGTQPVTAWVSVPVVFRLDQ